MGKRFEGEEPTFNDILAAYQRFGLAGLLGRAGEATAYAPRFPMGEALEFSVVPGTFTANEIESLRDWAA